MSATPAASGSTGAVAAAAVRRQANLRHARALLEAVNAFRTDDFLAGLTEDIAYEAPYYRDFGVRRGRAEVGAMLAAMGSRFSSLHYEVVDTFLMLDPDMLVLECRGDNVVAATGVHYRNHYLMFLTFAPNGLVRRWREFSNPDVFRTQAEGRA